eukprot:TRINITY_DN3734_c0_g1_i4.p1 TRINITY_DN3734_c0_g1~~TRINITY_DN3734_c0_g1_i4.p1  ORF type:complete len:299 (-),score=94.86 TRINITY_DN3734_c0_g1_i4:23-919(-)
MWDSISNFADTAAETAKELQKQIEEEMQMNSEAAQSPKPAPPPQNPGREPEQPSATGSTPAKDLTEAELYREQLQQVQKDYADVLGQNQELSQQLATLQTSSAGQGDLAAVKEMAKTKIEEAKKVIHGLKKRVSKAEKECAAQKTELEQAAVDREALEQQLRAGSPEEQSGELGAELARVKLELQLAQQRLAAPAAKQDGWDEGWDNDDGTTGEVQQRLEVMEEQLSRAGSVEAGLRAELEEVQQRLEAMGSAQDNALEEQMSKAGSVEAAVSYTHLRAHETVLDLVCRLLLEKKKTY